MEFGKRMRIKRKMLKWSQADLGDKVGVVASVICRIENGYDCRPKTLAAIKKILGLRGGALVPKKPKPTKAPKAKDPVVAALAEISESLSSIRALLVAAAQAAPSLVPPVAEQRRITEAMTQGIAKNGLRRPLHSNSLDQQPGVRLMPSVGAGA